MINNKITIKQIDDINNSNNKICIEILNTKCLNSSLLNRINNDNCYFKIYGGLHDIEFLPRYESRITYSLKEIKKIIRIIEKIEEDMPEDKMNKVLYIYDYIRRNIKYFPNARKDNNIRSLKILITKHAVCSGYALLFKELLDRQNIKCEYIKYYNHIWNRFCLRRKYYNVDLTWDACVYQKCNSSNLHYFANNRSFNREHHNIKSNNNYLSNNMMKEYNLMNPYPKYFSYRSVFQ